MASRPSQGRGKPTVFSVNPAWAKPNGPNATLLDEPHLGLRGEVPSERRVCFRGSGPDVLSRILCVARPVYSGRARKPVGKSEPLEPHISKGDDAFAAPELFFRCYFLAIPGAWTASGMSVEQGRHMLINETARAFGTHRGASPVVLPRLGALSSHCRLPAIPAQSETGHGVYHGCGALPPPLPGRPAIPSRLPRVPRRSEPRRFTRGYSPSPRLGEDESARGSTVRAAPRSRSRRCGGPYPAHPEPQEDGSGAVALTSVLGGRVSRTDFAEPRSVGGGHGGASGGRGGVPSAHARPHRLKCSIYPPECPRTSQRSQVTGIASGLQLAAPPP